MKKIQIKSSTGDVLFEYEEEENDIKKTLLKAIENRVNLCGADLADMDLSFLDLKGIDLRDVDLRGTDMRGTDLRYAILAGANWDGTNTDGADLSYAILSYPTPDLGEYRSEILNRINFSEIQYDKLNPQQPFDDLIDTIIDEVQEWGGTQEIVRILNQEYLELVEKYVSNKLTKKQNETISKVYALLPAPEPSGFTEEQKRYYRNEPLYSCVKCFLRYKLTGVLKFELGDEMFIYNTLYKVGLIDVTVDDKERARKSFFAKAVRGIINKFTARTVRMQGRDSEEVARQRKIKEAFDYLIENQLQISNYLNFK